jgi:hypothetical protein
MGDGLLQRVVAQDLFFENRPKRSPRSEKEPTK